MKNTKKINKWFLSFIVLNMLVLTTLLVEAYIEIDNQNSSSATYDKFIGENNGKIITERVTVRG